MGYNGFMTKSGVWYTYIVEAENGAWYTGISPDPQRRFEAHKSGKGGKFFKISPPKALVVTEKIGDYPQALRREAQIKKLSRKKKEAYAASPPSLEMPGAGADWVNKKVKKRKKKAKKKL